MYFLSPISPSFLQDIRKREVIRRIVVSVKLNFFKAVFPSAGNEMNLKISVYTGKL
jgi:hypothetical protein